MKSYLLLGLITIVLFAGCTAQTQEIGKTSENGPIQSESNTVYFAVSDYKLSKLDLNVSHPLIADKIRWNTTQISFYSNITDAVNYPTIKYGISAWNNATKAVKLIETNTPENAYFIIRYATSGELNKPLDGAIVILGEAKIDYTNTGLFNLSKSAEMVFTPTADCENKVTVIHELGHILGLGHTSEANSVMFNSVDCKAIITDSMKRAVETLYSTKELPDLYFSSIDAKKVGRVFEMNLTISNRGIVTSQNTSVAVKTSGKTVATLDVPQIQAGTGWWKIIKLQDVTGDSIVIEIPLQDEFDTENNIIHLKEIPITSLGTNIVGHRLDDQSHDNLILYGKTLVRFEYNVTCSVCLDQKKYLEEFARSNKDQIVLELIENPANPTSNITFESKKGSKELDTAFTDYYIMTKESKGAFQITDTGLFKKQFIPSYQNRTWVDPSTIDMQIELCRFMINPPEICNNGMLRFYNNAENATYTK
ncbi:MAG: matrixin family metalloprotease [Candidatus Aenigmarchaeota archaeon]|nr:matrixin family metalloprotease [Candidatus Aenigmarchaeota archaeon]